MNRLNAAVFLREEFSDEVLTRAEPLIETAEFTTQDVRELCLQANVVNQTITRNKILKAIRDPKKAMSILRALLEKKGQN